MPNRFRLLCLLTLPAALSGQRIISSGPVPQAPASLAALLREAAPRGLLVILDAGDEGFRKALDTLLAQEEVFARQLTVETLGDGAGAGLRTREGWDGAPRWALLDTRGRVAATDVKVPSPEAFLGILDEGGFLPYTRILEDFLQEHPGRRDALQALVRAHQQVALQRMEPFLEREPARDGEPPPPPRARSTFSAEEDARIWGPFARTLRAYVREGTWCEETGLGWPRLNLSVVALSPTVRGAAAQLLPEVGQALARFPASDPLWRLWTAFRSLGGGPEVLDFLGTLTPLPGDRRFPPEAATREIVATARAFQDWKTVIAFLTPDWAGWQETRVVVEGSRETRDREALVPWQGTVAPLMEAHLRLGETSKAEALLREALAWSGSTGYVPRAVALALACGQPELAERWKALAESPAGKERP